MGRGQEATREACERAVRDGTDELLVQEPYNVKGEIQEMNGRWYYCAEEMEVWAAVVVLNEKLRVVLNRDKNDRYVVSVTIMRERWKVTMLSVYCRFSLEIGGILHSVERVLREEGGKGA